MIDLIAAMERLQTTRPVFQSEADFLLALGWDLGPQDPTAKVRLEYRPDFIEGRVYLDTWITDGLSRAGRREVPGRSGLRASAVDEAFRIHEGSVLSATLTWATTVGGTARGRERPHPIRGAYSINWRPYSRVGDGPAGEFRYLLVEVTT